jgi:hypothetical protein
MQLRLLTFFLMLLAPHVGFAQVPKKVPVAVSHEGADQVGRSVANGLEDAIRRSQRFSFVATNATMPRIIILLESVEALAVPQLQGKGSALAISIVYYRRGIPGAGVFLGLAVNSCGPEIIESCAKSIIPHLERAADFLKQHDPDF